MIASAWSQASSDPTRFSGRVESFPAARVIEITLRQPEGGLPLKAQIDGEEFPATPRTRIEVLPRALRLIVPAEFATS